MLPTLESFKFPDPMLTKQPSDNYLPLQGDLITGERIHWS